jgi:23S rRNA (uracil1939-C5)-methyltransferase
MKSRNPGKGPQGSLLGQRIPLKIDKLAVGGDGLGRHEGMVVFVPFSVPGDEILVEITQQKSNLAFARILDFIAKSPERIEPPCPYYFECGGCNWQHVDPMAQLKYKQDLVGETLRKFLGFDTPVLPIIPSPRNWRYRNRIQLSAQGSRLGFKKRKSHDIIDIKDCLITEETLTTALENVRQSVKSPQQKIELYLTSQGQAKWEEIEDLGEGVGFSQVNRFQNEDLIRTVLEWARPSSKSILELYAGAGNFTWPLAQKFPESSITAVELSEKLVERALVHKKDFPQVHYLASDVEKYVQKSFSNGLPKPPDLVFLDPPRQGTTAIVMESLAMVHPQQILYLSCHPVSLARDLSYFLKAAERASLKYRLSRVQPFEMFPQTDHVETLVELVPL